MLYQLSYFRISTFFALLWEVSRSLLHCKGTMKF